MKIGRIAAALAAGFVTSAVIATIVGAGIVANNSQSYASVGVALTAVAGALVTARILQRHRLRLPVFIALAGLPSFVWLLIDLITRLNHSATVTDVAGQVVLWFVGTSVGMAIGWRIQGEPSEPAPHPYLRDRT